MSDNNGATQDDTKNAAIPSKTVIEEGLEQPLEIVIGGRLKQLAPVSGSYCIYKVPEGLRCVKPDVYTPKVVSIGPLHHDKKETLKDMEEHKYRYLQHFLHRTEKNLEYYIQKIKIQEAKLRGHYAEPIKLSSDDFVTIILVDSAFIIELLLKHYDGEQARDRIMKDKNLLNNIIFDLILLENQLPLFMLEDLYDPEKAGKKPSIYELSRKLFSDQLQDIGVDYDSKAVNPVVVTGVHFLDIARTLCLTPEKVKPKAVTTVGPQKATKFKCVYGTSKSDEPKPRSLDEKKRNDAAITAPSITELHRAGVKLRVRSTRNLFSVQFVKGVLEIPKITISDQLELTLRNLAAYEQCHKSDHTRVAEYLDLLDCFVNTSMDVELLVKYGIVTNILGDSSEACSLINRLCKGLYGNYNNSNFATLYEELHKHCKRPWNKWKASLRQNYLNTPWKIVSVVAATILILLTITQTVCSLVSVL